MPSSAHADFLPTNNRRVCKVLRNPRNRLRAALFGMRGIFYRRLALFSRQSGSGKEVARLRGGFRALPIVNTGEVSGLPGILPLLV
jgi:hypothetical protein